MQQSILKKITAVQFDANNRLENKPGQYVTLNVCFIHHQTDGEGGEYVDMVVSEGMSFDEGHIVYKERQVFDHDFLERLMRKEGNESKRRQHLIDIAHRLIP
ncbi:hypothetical protein QCD60_19730 [Pokkaliibacter sp. MBI-7]|nr:hypothetical protein [Pokkaliibacter sp. MBI-7]MDH2434775.1 hypothetical protein [Pokkaliibacter sp. MBI-7]